MDSDCGSPGSAAGGPGLLIAGGNRSASAKLDEKSPSPSSPRPDSSRSPSPENGHRRTQTQRVRDLLSSIDGLVQESEEALTGMPSLAPNGPHENGAAAAPAPGAGGSAPSRSVRGFKRQSTGAVDSRSGPSSRLSLRTPPPLDGEGDGSSHSDRAFFPNERDWRGSRFGSATTPPPELAAARRASVVPAAPGAEEEDDPASADILLAEVTEEGLVVRLFPVVGWPVRMCVVVIRSMPSLADAGDAPGATTPRGTFLYMNLYVDVRSFNFWCVFESSCSIGRAHRLIKYAVFWRACVFYCEMKCLHYVNSALRVLTTT